MYTIDEIQDIVNTANFVKYSRFVSGGLVLGILVYLSIFAQSYSEDRPKRLWIHHIDRDLTGLNEGKDSGLWVVGFDLECRL